MSLNHISPWIGGGDTSGEANNVAANASATATNQQAVPGENFFCHNFRLSQMLTKFCVVINFQMIMELFSIGNAE